MDNQRLGKGLSFLMGEEYLGQNTPDSSKEKIQKVSIGLLKPSRFQPRRVFNEETLDDLVKSIQKKGVLQPLLVRSIPMGGYEIIAGERRFRASQKAGLREVPVIIKDFDDKDALEVALIENLQREDLNPLEEAEAYIRLLKEYQYTQESLAEVLGKSRSYIANMMRLVELPDKIKELLESKQLTAGHARALLGVKKAEDLALEIINKGLTVRETEKLADKDKNPSQKRVKIQQKDEDICSLEEDLSQKLGMKVQIKWNGKKGTLSFKYNSVEQLQNILKRITDD